MKKVIMTIGFAAATIVAANAQEVMTEEEVQIETQEVVDATEAEAEIQTEETLESVEDAAADTEDAADYAMEETEEEVDQMTDEVIDATSQTDVILDEDVDPSAQVDELQEADIPVQASNEQIGEEGGVMNITEAELPQEVTKSLEESEFAQSTIEATYLLDEAAVDKLIDVDGAQLYTGDQIPDKLYQIRVSNEEERTLLVLY